MTAAIDHALVLAAGLGTRLRPLTTIRAKPAIPVAGEPLVRRITRWLVQHGSADIVVNLHHLPHTITSVLGDGSDVGARVRYSWEQPVILGSAGGPRQALDIIGAGDFFIVNGDTLTDLDLNAVASAHLRSGGRATLALVDNRQPDKYGGVRLEGDRVVGFVPRGPAAVGSFHFIGVQAVSASVFRGLPAGVPTRTIGGVYDDLIRREPGSVRGFVSDASFLDIGTVEDYVASCAALSPRAARAIAWDNVAIGEGAQLDGCILTDNVHVPANAIYNRAILMRGDHGDVIAVPRAASHD